MLRYFVFTLSLSPHDFTFGLYLEGLVPIELIEIDRNVSRVELGVLVRVY